MSKIDWDNWRKRRFLPAVKQRAFRWTFLTTFAIPSRHFGSGDAAPDPGEHPDTAGENRRWYEGLRVY